MSLRFRRVLAVALAVMLVAGMAPGLMQAEESATEQAGNPYVFGIASHAWWLDPEVYGDQLFDALDDLEVTTVRFSIDWRRFEPEQGVFDWSMYDRVVDELARRNIVIIANFNTIPDWASVDVAGCADSATEIQACQLREDMYPAFERAVQAAVSRYAWIEHWEFWNEPEMWTHLGGEVYLENLRRFYDIAHRVNPDVTVAACTLAGRDFMEWIWNVSDLRFGEGNQPWDAIAYHPYNMDTYYGPDEDQRALRYDYILDLRNLMVERSSPDMKMWITEYGWNNTAEVQARNLKQALDWMKRQPFIAFAHLHMLHDWSDDPVHAYGLMVIEPDDAGNRRLKPETRFTPKPLYYDAFKGYPRDGLPVPPHGEDVMFFAETGHAIRGHFLTAWRERGGLRTLGYPLTRPYPREKGDGSWLLVQDFERARLEFHPENLGEWGEVLGTLAGSDAVSERRDELPFRPLEECVPNPDRDCFGETGHSIAYGFRDFWYRHGGLSTFGYPISEEFTEDGRTVQYFERARFEWHPEQAGTEYEVLLGLLIRDELQSDGWLPAPSSASRLPTLRLFP